jgi:hypothetical protein
MPKQSIDIAGFRIMGQQTHLAKGNRDLKTIITVNI